jgi:hypothetical protein
MVVTILGLVASSAMADSVVRVHMIDAKTEMPIANKPVRVWVLDSASVKRPGYLEEKTDKDGVALFRFSDPLPAYLVIHNGMGGWWEECSPNTRVSYALREILEMGFAEEGFCGDLPKIATKLHPNPGDVYIFPVHYTFWQRLTRCGEFGCH